MQREIEALILAIGTTAGRRANVNAILQEILYAIQRHDAAIDEADHRLLETLSRAVLSSTAKADKSPVDTAFQDYLNNQQYQRAYANG